MGKLKLSVNNNIKDIVKYLNDLTESVDEAYKYAPQGKEFTKFIISRMENGECIYKDKEIINYLNDILHIIKENNKAKNNLIVKALFNLGATQEQIRGFMENLNGFDDLCECGIKTIIDTKIKHKINYIHKLNESAPAIEGYINGKKPRKKSQNQIDAENTALKMWEENKMLSLEKVAQEIIFKLDLTQSIATVISWIKPIDPLIGTGIKRKRQSKKK
ncbi:hypothetical protein [Mannheimia haemolytica]|uniref:hypothetical protein n=1 Tax=Mannheimia haemolytica TaxID=75985 RepID=UPI00201C7BE1|nr:hypothetical protein [Mannheimia haemolytica]UQX68908.1 hypothetical protein M3705_07800 [Mannheimia haemolytica]